MSESAAQPESGSAVVEPVEVLRQAIAWKKDSPLVALVTIVKAWPTAPMRAGSQMAVHADGRRCGSVFGPALDARVGAAAIEALAADQDRTLSLAVDDATASAAGLACGGGLEIRLEPLRDGPQGNARALGQTLDAVQRQRGVVLCTALGDSRRMVVATDSPDGDAWTVEALQRARADQTGIALVDGQEVLFQVFNAPLRLFVVGAVRIAAALVDAALLLGFEVSVIDPRPERAHSMPFAGARVLVGPAAEALREMALDERCAVVLLSHAPEIDDPALVRALTSRAFYIGALGSRRTHAARLARLEAAGLGAQVTARIHGPAGLPIGAIGPAEIAASIVAEIIAVLRRGEASARSR